MWSEQGIASWYGPRFQGKLTANGERFNTQTLTAAHKTLPFGTRVRVRSLSDAKEVIVRINDRGPFVKGRIIDLSQAAARVLGFVGVKQVVIERLP
jgi:rare lipoprotein A